MINVNEKPQNFKAAPKNFPLGKTLQNKINDSKIQFMIIIILFSFLKVFF